jgi:hypothetical protein
LWLQPCPAESVDDETHKIEVLNYFYANENVCIEYTHGAILTGEIAASLKPGTLRYCMAYHIRDGKLDRVHEYINSPSVRMSFLIPVGMKYLLWQSMRKLSKETGADASSGASNKE